MGNLISRTTPSPLPIFYQQQPGLNSTTITIEEEQPLLAPSNDQEQASNSYSAIIIDQDQPSIIATAQAQALRLKDDLFNLPEEMSIEVLKKFPLKDLLNFRLVNKSAKRIVDSILFASFPKNAFASIEKMNEFLREAKPYISSLLPWRSHLYNMVINKEIKKGDIWAIKALFSKPLAERSTQDLVDVGLLSESQREIVEISPAHASYMVSDAVILDLTQGVEPDFDKLLDVPTDWVAGGIMTAFLKLGEPGGQENFISMAFCRLFVQSRNMGNLGATPLHNAVANNFLPMVGLLLTIGAPINMTDCVGNTALHYAALFDLPEIAQELITRGADINFRNIKGQTPSHTAVEKRSVAVMRILLNARSNIDQEDKKGLTPLHYAVADNQPELVSLLITAGANLNVQSKKSWTPVHYAVAGKYFELIQTLLAAEPDINLQTKEGWTALHMAVLSRRIDFVELLIATGKVNWTLQDKAEQTVLGLAITLKYGDIIKILRQPHPAHPAPSLTWGNRFIHYFGSSIGTPSISHPVNSLTSQGSNAVEQNNNETSADDEALQQEVAAAEAPAPEVPNAEAPVSRILSPYEVKHKFFSEIDEKLEGPEKSLRAAYSKLYGSAMLLIFSSSFAQYITAPKDGEPIEHTPLSIAVSCIGLTGCLMLFSSIAIDYRRSVIGSEKRAKWA